MVFGAKIATSGAILATLALSAAEHLEPDVPIPQTGSTTAFGYPNAGGLFNGPGSNGGDFFNSADSSGAMTLGIKISDSAI